MAVKIHLIENNENLKRVLTAKLCDPALYRLTVSDSPKKAASILEQEGADILVANAETYGADLLELLTRFCHIPAILLSEAAAENFVLSLTREGACEILTIDEGGSYANILPYVINSLIKIQSIKAQKEDADHALRSLSEDFAEFAYIISHDLKAPVRGIRTLAEWILTDCGEKLDDEGKENLKMLMSRAQNLGVMLDGVLNYSRAGRIRPDFETMDLNQLAAKLIGALNTEFDGIEWSVETPLPSLFAGASEMSMIFESLLRNACQSALKKNKRGRVWISAAESTDEWIFTVKDNGVGIAEGDRENIFKIFRKNALLNCSESAGAGLAVVKKMLSFYQGKIWLDTQAGEGAVFHFSLNKSKTIK